MFFADPSYRLMVVLIQERAESINNWENTTTVLHTICDLIAMIPSPFTCSPSIKDKLVLLISMYNVEVIGSLHRCQWPSGLLLSTEQSMQVGEKKAHKSKHVKVSCLILAEPDKYMHCWVISDGAQSEGLGLGNSGWTGVMGQRDSQVWVVFTFAFWSVTWLIRWVKNGLREGWVCAVVQDFVHFEEHADRTVKHWERLLKRRRMANKVRNVRMCHRFLTERS